MPVLLAPQVLAWPLEARLGSHHCSPIPGPPRGCLQACPPSMCLRALASLLAPQHAQPAPSHTAHTQAGKGHSQGQTAAGCPPLQRNPETPIFLWVFFGDQCVVHRVFLLGSGCCRSLDPWPALGWGGKSAVAILGLGIKM